MKPYTEIQVVKCKQLLKSSRRGGKQHNNLLCLEDSLKPEDIQGQSNPLCFTMLGTVLLPGCSGPSQELKGLRGTCKTWLNAANSPTAHKAQLLCVTTFSGKFRQICHKNSAKQQVFSSETSKSYKKAQHTEYQNNLA